MILKLLNFDTEVTVLPDFVAVLEIHNKRLFSRMARSLQSGGGDTAQEPYLLLDLEGKTVKKSEYPLIVFDPFNLSQTDRALAPKIIDKFSITLVGDEELHTSFMGLEQRLQRELVLLSEELQGSYDFEVKWDVKRYLKAFGFELKYNLEESLLDNFISFLDYFCDSGLQVPLFLVNFKSFFDPKELESIYEHAFLLKISLLLIESSPAATVGRNEKRYIITADFLEEKTFLLVDDYSSSGGNAHGGFRAVSF